ncbi:MAG: hypothetical protein OXP66_16785 [Candidatus Tectomicrobia bacterium]|nr:hypothetical protein [Candidatus Tectomicrobia bacterium]
MSLVAVVKGPEGVVLGADTRLTLTVTDPNGSRRDVNYDNATKFLTFPRSVSGVHVAAVTYGNAIIDERSVPSYTPEIEMQMEPLPQTVEQYAVYISEFFQNKWDQISSKSPNSLQGSITIIVGGYDSNKPHGSVYDFTIPQNPLPRQHYEGGFGMRWGGQLNIANRIIFGFDPDLIAVIRNELSVPPDKAQTLLDAARSRLEYAIPYRMLPLQDCIDLVTFLIRTTITAQSLSTGMRGVGGAIEVASITRTGGFAWVQKRDMRGERR